VSAIGVAAVLMAGLTLLPALLTAAGRRGFWPRSSSVAYQPDVDLVERRGLWRRFGDRVLRRPGLALGATTALFAVGTLGLLSYKEDYSIGGFFKKSVESVDGFETLGDAFPQGALGPTSILVVREGGNATVADVAEVRRRVEQLDGVASVGGAAAIQGSSDREARRDVQRRSLLGGGARARGHVARPAARPSRLGHCVGRCRQRGAGGLQRGG
jgi:uncharacterized membrane protein YdfJ with MMPL/SSD domain